MTFNLNMRTMLMIGIALIAAAFTALLARGWINSQRAQLAVKAPIHEVLVAKVDIGPGSFVKAQDLRWQAWPEGTLAPTYVLKGTRTPGDFEGAVVRKGVVAGQPITDGLVVRPGEQGFLAAVLTPGMRAVSIQVNATSGISGFVQPGDRVDMVLTHTIPSDDRRRPRHVSETVLEDIRVIAVDQRIDDKANKASIAKNVTFEVTPKQVEKIGIINTIGKIALSLRPIAREPMPGQAGDETLVDAGAPGRAVEMAQPRPAAKPEEETAPVAPTMAISPASAAEITEDAGAPTRLIEPPAPSGEADAVQAAEVKADVDAQRAMIDEPAGKETATASKPARKAAVREVRLPKRDRAGITMDSEVSRVLGIGPGRAGKTVQVLRGSKAEEQKF